MDDKKTIGLTLQSRETLERMSYAALFEDYMDAAKFALALAIREGVLLGTAERTDTTWNIGSFDPDGEVRQVITAFYPGAEVPYRQAEYLLNEGFKLLAQHIAEHGGVDADALLEG